MEKISVVFFGTPDIGLPSLKYFYESEKFELLAVVTQPDKPSGRGQKLTPSPIKQFAQEHDIKVFQPKSIRKEPDIIQALKELKPDFFVTFAFALGSAPGRPQWDFWEGECTPSFHPGEQPGDLACSGGS